MPESADVTSLLLAYGRGDREAFDQLLPMVYDDLRKVARRQLNRVSNPDKVLDTTVLVHESYLKMVDQNRVDWTSRAHFLGVAARAMRQVVIDWVRRTS